jgi:hypothetical protein
MEHLLLFAQTTGAPELVGGILSMVLILWVIAIAATVFWVWMLVDALTEERTTEQKLLWFLVVFLLHFVGALVYFIVRKSGRRSTLAR